MTLVSSLLPRAAAMVGPQTLALLAAACHHQHRGCFTYTDYHARPSTRSVEPHRLVHSGRYWYLMAYDLDRAAWRFFRVDRIADPHDTAARFTPRPARWRRVRRDGRVDNAVPLPRPGPAARQRALAEEGTVRPVIAARLLGLSEKTVRAWAAAGALAVARRSPRLLLDVLSWSSSRYRLALCRVGKCHSMLPLSESRIPMFGREAELGLLTGLLDAVQRSGAALVLRGEPGIGKSRLLAEAMSRARQRNMSVLATRGVQSEARLAFAGLQQMLRPVRSHSAGAPAPAA